MIEISKVEPYKKPEYGSYGRIVKYLEEHKGQAATAREIEKDLGLKYSQKSGIYTTMAQLMKFYPKVKKGIYEHKIVYYIEV